MSSVSRSASSSENPLPSLGPVQQVASVDAFQQILFDEVIAGHNIAGAFPLTQSLLSAYAFTALSLPGMTMVVCQDANQIQLNCDTLSLAGVVYPEVAILDGTQTPHLVRDTYEAINQRKTRLLFVTPKMMGTLPFIQMMTHTTVSLIVVEEAQYLLPIFRETELLPIVEHLHRLRTIPPLCLFSGPVPSDAMGYFAALFPARKLNAYQMELGLLQARCVVHRMINQRQKFGRLQQLLLHPPNALDKPLMPTVIITADEASAFQVVTGLDQLDIEPVYLYPSELSHVDNRLLREKIRQGQELVLVSHQVTGRFLVPGDDIPYRVVYWNMPESLPILYSWMAGGCKESERTSSISPSENDPTAINLPKVTVEVFYTKEDFKQQQEGLTRQPVKLHTKKHLPLVESLIDNRREYQRQSLDGVRQFCLSDNCRVVDLAQSVGVALQFDTQYTCGWCDFCQGSTSPMNAGFLMKGLQRLLY